MAATASATTLCEVREVWHDFTLPNGQPLRVLENINLAISPARSSPCSGRPAAANRPSSASWPGCSSPTRARCSTTANRSTASTPASSIVFQSFALYPWMTVVDNIRTVLVAAGLKGKDVHARAEAPSAWSASAASRRLTRANCPAA